MTSRKVKSSARERQDAEQIAEFVKQQGDLAVSILPDNSVAALVELLFTRAIILGCTQGSWAHRFCFNDRELAVERFLELQSEDDEPQGFVARR